MKVATRLHIATALPVMLAIVISMILLFVSLNAESVAIRTRRAAKLIRELFSLNAETHAYVLSSDPAVREEWETHFARIQSLLEDKGVTSEEEYLLKRMRNTLKDLKAEFNEQAELAAGESSSPDHPRGPVETSGFESEELWNKSQALTAGSLAMGANAYEESVAAQGVAFVLIVVVSMTLAAILAFFSVILSRSMVKNVIALSNATRSFGRGDYAHRVPVDSDDELGEIAAAFNSMGVRLKESHDTLQSEIESRESTAETLRQTNRELSQALERLKRAQTETIESERLHALSQVSSGIIHDINDGLAGILGMTELLLASPAFLRDEAEIRKRLGTMRSAASRVSYVMKHLSDFFNPSLAGTPTSVEITQLLKEVIDSTMPAWKRQKQAEGVKLEMSLNFGAVPSVQCSESALREAITTIILNAADSMPDGGTLTVSTSTADKNAVIEISDTGCGMSPEQIGRCFEPFYSTKGEGHSGMGLTVARNAVLSCGGDLKLASTPDQGTTVTIQLPITTASTGRPAAKSAASRALSILLVDDEPMITEILAWYLIQEGHTVQVANNGSDALTACLNSRIELAIVDRAMPDMSGDQVAAKIRELNNNTRIIMITAFVDAATRSGRKPAGVDVILGKPFSRETLADTIAGLFS